MTRAAPSATGSTTGRPSFAPRCSPRCGLALPPSRRSSWSAPVLVSVLLAVNYATVISLYEGLHAGVVGGIALTIAQLAFMPNFVIWTASLARRSRLRDRRGVEREPARRPSSGRCQPCPFSARCPPASLAFGFVGLLVPLVVGFLVGGGAAAAARRCARRRPTDRGRGCWDRRSALGSWPASCSGSSPGSRAAAAGPGRLVEVGPDPVLVGLFAALELGVACTLGAAAVEATARLSSAPR